MIRQIFTVFGIAVLLSGCTISTRLRVYDDPPARSTTSAIPRLAVTKPALCNDYPVEYRKSGSPSEITMATVDFWFFSSKPKTCVDQPTVEEPKKERRLFRRFWK
jgi:hypothetical protein